MVNRCTPNMSSMPAMDWGAVRRCHTHAAVARAQTRYTRKYLSTRLADV